MASSSSKAVIKLQRPLRDVTLVLHDGSTTAEARSGAPSGFDLKTLQRRAFERGVAVERDASTKRLHAVVQGLESAVADLASRSRHDRRELEEFAVRLACLVAGRVTGTIVDEGAHDVLATVREVLAEVAGCEPDETPTVALCGDDLARLLDAMGDEARPAFALVEDATLAPGDVRVRGSEVDYHATLSERLEALREKLVEEARHG